MKIYGVKIIIKGSKDEKKLTGELKEMIGEKGVFDFDGKTNLRELAAVYELSDLVVSNNTGSMHLALQLVFLLLQFLNRVIYIDMD